MEWTSVCERKSLPWPSRLRCSWVNMATQTSSPFITISTETFSVSSVCLELLGLLSPRLCELLGVGSPDANFVMLDSAAKPGRFTRHRVVLPSTLCIRYTHPESYVTLQRAFWTPPRVRSRWHLGLARRILRSRTVQHLEHEDVPFWEDCGV